MGTPITNTAAGLRTPSKIITLNVSASTQSDVFDLTGVTLVGVRTPTGISSTTLSFEVNTTNSTTGLKTLYNADGTVFTVTCSADGHFLVQPADLASVRYARLITGATENDKDFVLVTRPIA